MANGFPQGFPPYYDVAPAAYGPQLAVSAPPAPEVASFAAQPEEGHDGRGRRGDAWTGVWVVAGGVVGLAGLLAWVAVKNDRQCRVLHQGIGDVTAELDDYIEAHSIEHAKIAQRQAVVDDYLSRNVDRIWTALGVPRATRKTMPMEPAPVPPMAASLPPYVEPVLSRVSSPPSYARLTEAALAASRRSSRPPSSLHGRSTAPANLPSAAAYEAEGLPVPSFRAVSSPYSRTLTGMSGMTGVGTAAPVSRAYVEALEEATAFPTASSAFSEAPTQVFSPVSSVPALALSRAISTAPTGNGALLDFSAPRSARSASFRPSVVPVVTTFPASLGLSALPASAGVVEALAVPTLRSADLPTLTALVTQRAASARPSRASRIGDGQPLSSRSSRSSSRRSHRSKEG